MGMPGMGQPGQMGFDASAAYKQEKEILLIAKHSWAQASKAEKQLLGDKYYPKRAAGNVMQNIMQYSK